MNRKLMDILEILSDTQYITAEALALRLNMGVKTVRIRLKDLDEILSKHGAKVIFRQRKGCRLSIDNQDIYETFIKSIHVHEKQVIPTTPDEREQYILILLLNRRDYIKMDDLSSFLFISKTSLAGDLKKVEVILNRYGITLIRKPNYGIKVGRREHKIRACLADNYMKYNSAVVRDWDKEENEIKNLGTIVLDKIKKYKLHFSEVAFQNVLTQLYISIRRMKREFFIDELDEAIRNSIGAEALMMAEEIAACIKKEMNVDFIEAEIQFLAIHLAGKRAIDENARETGNLLITEEIQGLVYKMLDQVYTGFRLDFRMDFELRISLSQHMIPFDIRLKYGIPLKNPMLEDIKKQYMFAYTVASHASIPLKEHYKKEIPEGEIGYFALIFALAIEKQGKQTKKKKILLVCSSGKGSSQLLAFHYKKEFGQYVDQIQVCDTYQVGKVDFSDIDCVFTTVSLSQYIPVPVFLVNRFLGNEDIAKVRHLLEKEDLEFLCNYYQESLFFPDVTGANKTEVLTDMCERIADAYELPPGFLESVLKREGLGATDYGNLIAMPHPFKAMTEHTFVSIGILDKPILWEKNMVQIVFLVSISIKKSDLQNFYDATMSLLANENSIRTLIESKKFHTLMHLLSES